MGEVVAAGAALIHTKHTPMILHLLINNNKIRFKGWLLRGTIASWVRWVSLSTPKARATTPEEAAMLQEEEAVDLEEADKDIRTK